MKSNLQKRRVVITGMGAVSPFGDGVDMLVNNLLADNCSIEIDDELKNRKDTSSILSSKVPPIDFSYIPRRFSRIMPPMSLFAYNAVRESLNNAGFKIAPEKTGLFLGADTYSSKDIAEKVLHYINGNTNLLETDVTFKILPNASSIAISQAFDLNGASLGTSAACATGLLNVGIGYLFISAGFFDSALCGGTEEYHPSTTCVFSTLNAASNKFNDNPKKSSRPFDSNRNGIVCSEGCGMLFLETLDSALERKAKIYGEIIGFGTNTETKSLSRSLKESIIDCIKSALKSADLKYSDIDFINAHATGTTAGDIEESKAISEVFGNNIWVNSLKGHIGHTMAASGSLELIAILKMMEIKKFAGTLNLENIDEKCSGIKHFTGIKNLEVNTFIKNSFGIGGVNSSLIIRRYK